MASAIMNYEINKFRILRAGCVATLLLVSPARSALIGWYRFDEGAGNVAIDSAGGNGAVPNTLSGSDDDGALLGGVTYVPGIAPPGSPGAGPFALRFDGDGRVDLGGAQDLLQNVRGATFAAWVSPSMRLVSDLEYNIMGVSTNFADGSTSRFLLQLSPSNGPVADLRVIARDTETGNPAVLEPGTVGSLLSRNRVYHVAATVDYAADTLELFVNGQSVGFAARPKNFSASQTTPDTPSTGAFIGALGSGFATFQGTLDDVRIYDTVLSHEEIAALAVPEPSSGGLFLGGIATFLLASRRRLPLSLG
jgi:hypothetical protein